MLHTGATAEIAHESSDRLQACYKIRLVDPAGCLPAIRRLRAQLKKYRRDVASTTIQAAGRGVELAGKALVMSQIKLRNERDERVAAAIISPYYELCTRDMKLLDYD